jgi:hypothetical protein
MRIIASLFLMVIFISCADLHQSEQNSRINKLNNQVDSLLIVLNQINDPKLSLEIKQNQSLLSDLTELYVSDTLLETEAKLIDNYATILGRLSSIKKQMESIELTLKEQGVALIKLEKDIINGFGKRNEYDKNLFFEQKKFKKIEIQINRIKAKKQKTLVNIAFLNLKIRVLQQKKQLKHRQT